MSTPRLEINLDKIQHNASSLVERLAMRGIGVTGVTKAFLGRADIAHAFLRAGVRSLGDSRLKNIGSLRRANIASPLSLIRSPMLSQVEQVVALTDISFNTELDVIRELSSAAHGINRIHKIILMVELGDLREGIMPIDIVNMVREILALPNIQLQGIGTNLACRCGVSPDSDNMAELSCVADAIEARFDLQLRTISGGNSGNLQWALSTDDTGRINDLRLGESILLGRETLQRKPIDGLYTDAISLVAEVIESKNKPAQPWGKIAQNAFGEQININKQGNIAQAILAIGRQDIDPDGLKAPQGIDILGASSDHLILDAGKQQLAVGSEIRFQLNYSALTRAMSSPFVTQHIMPHNEHVTVKQLVQENTI